MDREYIELEQITIQKLPKEVLVDKILFLQQYISNLKETNNELINKINEYSMIANEIKKYEKLKSLTKEINPLLIKMLEIVGEKENTNKSTKRYTLSKVKNKKHGFLYYVRYSENGKIIPSRWNTHTNNLEIAKMFAEENRMRILTEYQKTRIMKNSVTGDYGNMFKTLKNFYSKDSIYLKYNEQLNHSMNEKARITCYHIINKIFIPYLKKNEIKKWDELNASVIGKFQFYLIEKGKSPQSIIRYLKSIKYIYTNLVMMGVIEKNIFEDINIIKLNKS
jgi:hypothetical protein